MGLQNGEPGFKLIWEEMSRPELPGFTVWTKKSWELWSFPNKIQETGDPKSPVWGFSVRGARNLGFTEKSSQVILRPCALRPDHELQQPTARSPGSQGKKYSCDKFTTAGDSHRYL